MHWHELFSLGNMGNLEKEHYKDQLQRASSLNLIINAISIWNTVYLSQAIEHFKNTGKYQEIIAPTHITIRMGTYKLSRRIFIYT